MGWTKNIILVPLLCFLIPTIHDSDSVGREEFRSIESVVRRANKIIISTPPQTVTRDDFQICIDPIDPVVPSKLIPDELKYKQANKHFEYDIPDPYLKNIRRICVSFHYYDGDSLKIGDDGKCQIIPPNDETKTNNAKCIEEIDSTTYIQERKEKLLGLMKSKIKASHKYLLLGAMVASPKVQRPGLAKYLRELSNDHWEESFDILKKFLERGGSLDASTKDKNKFNVKLPANLFSTAHLENPYHHVLKILATDSMRQADDINKLIDKKDGDFMHFLQELMRTETKRSRKAIGYYHTVESMAEYGPAVFEFDKNLLSHI